MSTSPASTVGQSSPSPQAQSKAQNLLRKPIRRPASGSVSSQPISSHSTISSSKASEYPTTELAGSVSPGIVQPINNGTASHETMSQRSSISESPSYNGAQEDKALSNCKLCNHCKSGELTNHPSTWNKTSNDDQGYRLTFHTSDVGSANSISVVVAMGRTRPAMSSH